MGVDKNMTTAAVARALGRKLRKHGYSVRGLSAAAHLTHGQAQRLLAGQPVQIPYAKRAARLIELRLVTTQSLEKQPPC